MSRTEMDWTITHGDILTQPADVLICSANIYLNLSGGVGGEILLRHGRGMQDELHQFLKTHQKRFVEQGDVIATGAYGLPFKSVLHAVAVNGFYETSPAIVRATIEKALNFAASLGARSVALTALGTGFGRMSMNGFAQAIAAPMPDDIGSLTSIVVCLKSQDDRNNLIEALAAQSTS